MDIRQICQIIFLIIFRMTNTLYKKSNRIIAHLNASNTTTSRRDMSQYTPVNSNH